MSIHDKGSIKSHSNNNPRDDNVLGLRSEKCVGHIGTDTRYKIEPFLDKIYIFRFGCKKNQRNVRPDKHE